MDPIESWVDVSELRRMADALLIGNVGAAEPEEEPEEPSFGKQFEGFGTEATQRPVENLEGEHDDGIEEDKGRGTLAAARELARKGGLLGGARIITAEAGSSGGDQAIETAQVGEVAEAAVHSREESDDAMIKRLAPFGGWLRDELGSRAFFLLERRGAVLVDEAKSEKLHHLARTLAQAAFTAKRQAGTAAVGNLHIKVQQGSVLEVIPVNTGLGLLVLGVLLEDPLLPRQVEAAARGLQQVVDAIGR